MNRQNATDYDGNQGETPTKHQALQNFLMDEREDARKNVSTLESKVEYYQEQLYHARQELNQLPDVDSIIDSTYQELAALAERRGVIVPDELLADDEHDDGTGRSCDPHCSCSACIEDLQRRLSPEAGQAALGVLVGIVSILVFAALMFAAIAYTNGPVFPSPW